MRKILTSLWFLGISTLLLFPLLAWLVIFLSGGDFFSLFQIQWRQLISVPAFISAGIIFGLFVIYLTDLPYFDKSLSKYRNLLSDLKITRFQAFFLSFAAGFGEEVFFRGAIQPWLGIWITAFLFVAIHGYFSFKNWPVNIFAFGLTLFIALIGWSAIQFSIWHAIAAHFSYDLVLLLYHRRTSVYSG
ncbi:MAG: CPBP family intramembrane metalloprotease [Crocinitomicaceae bacterium]|nr:CPBP family intramembrane metalloprotease [Crocinitomicaceae bacterium]